jgi:hypothetical protein
MYEWESEHSFRNAMRTTKLGCVYNMWLNEVFESIGDAELRLPIVAKIIAVGTNTDYKKTVCGLRTFIRQPQANNFRVRKMNGILHISRNRKPYNSN